MPAQPTESYTGAHRGERSHPGASRAEQSYQARPLHRLRLSIRLPASCLILGLRAMVHLDHRPGWFDSQLGIGHELPKGEERARVTRADIGQRECRRPPDSRIGVVGHAIEVGDGRRSMSAERPEGLDGCDSGFPRWIAKRHAQGLNRALAAPDGGRVSLAKDQPLGVAAQGAGCVASDHRVIIFHGVDERSGDRVRHWTDLPQDGAALAAHFDISSFHGSNKLESRIRSDSSQLVRRPIPNLGIAVSKLLDE